MYGQLIHTRTWSISEYGTISPKLLATKDIFMVGTCTICSMISVVFNDQGLWSMMSSGRYCRPVSSVLSQRVGNFGYSGHYPAFFPPLLPPPAPLFATFQISIRRGSQAFPPCCRSIEHHIRIHGRSMQIARRGSFSYRRPSGVSHSRLQSGTKFAPPHCQTPKCNETGISGYIRLRKTDGDVAPEVSCT